MTAKKRTSLDAVFGPEAIVPARSGGQGAAAKKAPARAKTKKPAVQEEQGRGSEPAAKRPGIKQHTAYLPLQVHEQLRKLAFEENGKIHDYLIEGLDRVFADRGLPAIKDIS